jgi:Ca-activated chloride channel family protein
MVTDFLPSHIRSNLLSGTYFRYLAPDDVSTIQSGWLKAPSNVTIYSYYGSSYKNWSADAYGPVSSCDYALARNPIEPVASSQNAAMAFVDLLNTDRDEAGLVTYAWAAILEHALTDNFAALKTSIAAYDPRGATATPAGMQAANDEFILSGRASAYGHRVMVLLTDGMANTVSGTYYDNPSSKVRVSFFGEQVSCYIYQAVATALETQTRRARENGIRVYTVSFGTDSDKDLMPRIARATNGAYYYAADHQDLTDIFQDIFYNLPAVLTK